MTLLVLFRVNRKKAKSKTRAWPGHADFTVMQPGYNKKVLDSAEALLYLVSVRIRSPLIDLFLQRLRCCIKNDGVFAKLELLENSAEPRLEHFRIDTISPTLNRILQHRQIAPTGRRKTTSGIPPLQG